jgi:hypothetical protein
MSRPPETGLPRSACQRDERWPTANAVVYALVVALLDLEQRRDRRNVRRPMDRTSAR